MDSQKMMMFDVLDLEEHYHNSKTNSIIILSDINFTDKDNNFSRHVFSKQHELDFVASCDCGHINGNFNVGAQCPLCRTEVTPVIKEDRTRLPNMVWIEFPQNIKGVLHPVFYNVLSNWLMYNNKVNNYIDTILNPKEELPQDLENVLMLIHPEMSMKEKRGFNFFHDNFDILIQHFVAFPNKKKKAKEILFFIAQHRHKAFTRHMPALSQVLHPISSQEDTYRDRKYADRDSKHFLIAAQKLSFIKYNDRFIRSSDDYNKKIFDAFKEAQFYMQHLIPKRLSQKQGLLRKHVFGARYHWSARSVISPIPEPHEPTDLHVPWSIAVNLFKIHIQGRLLNKYSLQKTLEILHKSETKYNKEIDQIFNDLMNEYSPFPGIPVLFNRNPSMRRGATQLFFITKIKDNIKDLSISLSVLVLKAPNADFDGDALNLLAILEYDAVKKYMRMHPSQTYTSSNTTSISDDNILPKQPMAILSKYQDYT